MNFKNEVGAMRPARLESIHVNSDSLQAGFAFVSLSKQTR